jgi:hypothetical protein
MVMFWSVVVAGLGYLCYCDWRLGGIMGLVVTSHWVLDFLVHLPDLSPVPGCSTVVGLELWGSGSGLVLSRLVEFVLFARGLTLYMMGGKRPISAKAGELS